MGCDAFELKSTIANRLKTKLKLNGSSLLKNH